MHQGKFVLSQIMEFAPYYQFKQCVEKYRGHYRMRRFSCWDQFLSMAFGQLAHRESLRDIVNCLRSQKNDLYHLGFSGEISRSTLADANENRSWEIYRDFTEILIREARALYVNDHEFSLDLDGACYAIDSTVIELCLNIFPWAKMKTVRAAVKLNLQLDLRGNIPAFFRITNAREHDMKFLDVIDIEVGAYYILDRGYVNYRKLYYLHQGGAFFVIRPFRDMGFTRMYSSKVDKSIGLRCDQVIRFNRKLSFKNYPGKLRRVKYFDKETKRSFVFITNDFNIPAMTVADLYRNRWQIELFFKWIKQHLKINSFWGYSENAVRSQICIAMSAYLIVAIAKKKLGIKRNLYEILQILNVTLLTKNPIDTLFLETTLEQYGDQFEKQAGLFDF